MAGVPLAPAVAEALLRAPYAHRHGQGVAGAEVIAAAFVTARRCVTRHRAAAPAGSS
jgi:hypothetical protein